MHQLLFLEELKTTIISIPNAEFVVSRLLGSLGLNSVASDAVSIQLGISEHIQKFDLISTDCVFPNASFKRHWKSRGTWGLLYWQLLNFKTNNIELVKEVASAMCTAITTELRELLLTDDESLKELQVRESN